MEIGIREAKNDLSKLIEAALAGTDVIITKRGKPLVRLVPEAAQPDAKRGRGSLRDVVFPAGWDSRQMDDDIAELFEGSVPNSRIK